MKSINLNVPAPDLTALYLSGIDGSYNARHIISIKAYALDGEDAPLSEFKPTDTTEGATTADTAPTVYEICVHVVEGLRSGEQLLLVTADDIPAGTTFDLPALVKQTLTNVTYAAAGSYGSTGVVEVSECLHHAIMSLSLPAGFPAQGGHRCTTN